MFSPKISEVWLHH